MLSKASFDGFVLAGLQQVHHCVVVSGNIGAGKSTLMAGFQRWITKNRRDATVREHMEAGSETDVFFLLVGEPVNGWRVAKYTLPGETEKTSILGASYKNARLYGFPFQVNACMSRLCNISSRVGEIIDVGKQRRVIIIAERWMADDHLFFTAVCESNEGMELALDVYEQSMYPLICAGVAQKADVMIYLPVAKQTCETRIEQRARVEETGDGKIDSDYMGLLARKHDALAQQVADDPTKLLVRLDVFEQALDTAAVDREVDSLMTTIMAY